MTLPTTCKFCGAQRLVTNHSTGIIVFACLTSWDSQRDGREGH